MRKSGEQPRFADRGRNQRSLRESEELFRLLAENASDLIYLIDLEGRTVYASPSVGRVLGWDPADPKQMIDVDPFARIHAEDLALARRSWDRVLAGEEVFPTVRSLHRDGSWIWLEASASLVQYRGKPHVMSVCRDISQRRQAEQTLRDREADLALALESGRLGDWHWDIATGEIVWSAAFKAIHGLPLDTEPSYERFLAAVHPSDRERVDAALERAVKTRGKYEIEMRIVWPDGSVHWNSARGRVFCDAGGEPMRMAGLTVDVTERERAHEALRERTEELNNVLASVSDYLWSGELDAEGVWSYRFYSPVVETITGRPPEFFLASPERWLSTIHPDDRARMEEAFLRVVQRQSTREEAEYRIVHADGTVRWIRDSATAVPLEGGRLRIDGVASDITARKEVERKLRALVENMPDFVSRFDDQARLTYVNPAVTKAFGASESEILGETLLDPSLPARGPYDEMLHEAILQALREGLPNAREALWSVAGGDRHFEVRHFPEHDDSGRVVSVLGVAHDVTERRRAEQQLRASLREKEVLLREVHHRVKNNLQLITSLLALQAGQMRDSAIAGALTESQHRVRAMALVHENLYRSSDLATIHLAEHVEAICAQLYRSYGTDPNRIALDLRVADVALDLDRSMRCGLIINELVSNALKHAFVDGRSGRIVVQLATDRPDECILTVQDDGAGHPPNLDPRQCGTLGLQLVADLTEHLGGTLTFDRDGGTRVRVRFRVASTGDTPP
jgi:PAS domain S-box-containing protein